MGGSKRSRSGRERANPNAPANPRRKEDAELLRLKKAVADIPRFSNRFQLFRQNRRQKAKQLLEQKDSVATENETQPLVFRASRFSDLPLSKRSLDGLVAAGFTELTGIQKNAIPQALAGRDVLAAAPTGSGKTIAFLVPLMEALWRNKWNTLDGLGALVLSPTRELSMQIFEVLRSVARKHAISAGLVIGGKDFDSERERVGNMNVLVATPGRMLHHMDHVAELDCSNLQVLVLDEADRILDMGFAKTVDAILANLPKQRQTLLFSATQTKSIKSLARLSLKDPEYVAVASRESPEEDGNAAMDEDTLDKDKRDGNSSGIKIVGTPVGLSQSYAVVPAHDKLSVLWSFIKTHLKSKMIIFLASGKQVRFVFETFCKLRPGMSLLHIHGNMKQLKRTDMYDLFCRTKSAALFATDVASRGLDFPDVEWVIQLDCPDDVGTYVHRVGRTARFKSRGRAMLLLNEGKEENFLVKLKEKKLDLHKTKINPNRITSIEPRVAATVASNQELKNLSQRAFTFYVKSVYQQSDKDVFDVNAMDLGRLAKSYGLSLVPKIAFKKTGISGQSAKESKEKSKTVFGYRVRPDAVPKERKARPATVVEKNEDDGRSSQEDREGGEEILTLKKVHEVSAENESDGDIGDSTQEAPVVVPRKRKRRKLDLLKAMPSSNRIVFTEDGEAIRAADVLDDDEGDVEEDDHDGISDYAASVSQRLALNAEEDKDRERERVRSIHARRRAQQREKNRIIRPAADSQIYNAEGISDDGLESGSQADEESDDDLDNSSDSSDDDNRRAEPSLADEERIALQILNSRK